jgi:DNA ligase-associated metallophosphoesterase
VASNAGDPAIARHSPNVFANASQGAHDLLIEAAGESLLCLPEHALFWARERTLFVADVHLGKAASFRAAGVPLPSGHSSHDLARLSTLLLRHSAARLVILGDLVHDAASYTETLDRNFRTFRSRHDDVDMVLISGNHDRRAGFAPDGWQLQIVAEPHVLGPIYCCHEPGAADTAGFELAGHLHPATRIQTARESVTLPCFWRHAHGLVLPAFGSLTGKFVVRLRRGESAIAVAGQRLHALNRRE